jgi:branched-chain amino acid transport system permease protein
MVIGLPTFQLKGHYFVMATVALSAIVYVVVINWPDLGGASGIYLPILESGLENLEFGRVRIAYYWVGLGLLSLFLLLSLATRESRLGFWFRAVRDDEIAAASVGVPVLLAKSLAVGISGALSAVAGAFYAAFTLYISPDTVLDLLLSVEIALVAILGGAGTLFGPLLGAIVLVPIEQYANALLGGQGKGLAGTAYAVIIIVVALFEPRGLMHWLSRARRAIRSQPRAIGGSGLS